MIIFKLPDLGEGLAEAEIREWYVKEGDTITKEQALVSVETAKAVLDIPSPFSGTIEKLFGAPNDVVATGQALVGFFDENKAAHPSMIDEEPEKKETERKKEEKKAEAIASIREDKGTVVGEIKTSDELLIGQSAETAQIMLRITPKARALAKELNIDVSSLASPGQLITPEMVRQAAQRMSNNISQNKVANQKLNTPTFVQRAMSGEKITTVAEKSSSCSPTPTQNSITQQETNIDFGAMRHSMFDHMIESHRDVVGVTIFDEADIDHWFGKDDITQRLIQAIITACKVEPLLNASLDDKQLRYRLNPVINLGLAIDSPHGLYVPVIKDAAALTPQAIRQKIERFKFQAREKQLKAEDLHDATISLSNFGSIAGKFANAVILPPQVAIIAAGKCRRQVVAVKDAIAIHTILPISLSFDHRLITGGEAARFLACLLSNLEAF